MKYLGNDQLRGSKEPTSGSSSVGVHAVVAVVVVSGWKVRW